MRLYTSSHAHGGGGRGEDYKGDRRKKAPYTSPGFAQPMYKSQPTVRTSI